MPSPIVTFGFIVATLLSAVFHLIAGGDARRLALFLLSGWIGFGLGHLLGVIFEVNLLNIGTLRIVSAAFGACVALLVAHFLTASRSRVRSTR